MLNEIVLASLNGAILHTRKRLLMFSPDGPDVYAILPSKQTDTKKRQIRVHRAFKLYAKDLHPHATTRDMIRYGLRFAGHGMIREMSSLDVGISQARIRQERGRGRYQRHRHVFSWTLGLVASDYVTRDIPINHVRKIESFNNTRQELLRISKVLARTIYWFSQNV